jgi:hypothetical protein
MFEGHPAITGGVVSINAALQHRGPPFLLVAATMEKLPYKFPTSTDPQLDGMVALATALTVIETSGPTNLSLDIEPTNENVSPGLTTPENTVLI